MALVKCPRCELNYILDGEKLCTVCRKEVRGESEPNDVPELCSECGEHPAVPGGELCVFCLKEMSRRLSASSTDDTMMPEDPTIEIDSVSSMEEIELDIGDSGMAAEFGADEEFKDHDEEEEAEEDPNAPLSIDDMKEKDDLDEEEEE